MQDKDTILRDLPNFTGTTHWYRIYPKVLLTDGTKYLADAADAYWLMDAVASHIMGREKVDSFAVVKLDVVGSAAVLTLDDGNGNVFASQDIPFTTFPLDEILVYCEWDGQRWTILLPSEH
ncbi:DUF6876 family protein [Cupriavidus basilensis]|uniref:DUF6876 family protein n=1 Tax=Cupriavidus basilensis TaxID=68895 RepID=UPI0020A6B657|nr:DUF6876 family protein [Cupriavidus basilensis]MCP3017439.1 hypothetical protein [Cupriavidus basilensis]